MNRSSIFPMTRADSPAMLKDRHKVKLIRLFLRVIPAKIASRQFRKPRGFLGKKIFCTLFEIGSAKLLAFMLSMKEHRADDNILDIGFGPGKLFIPLMNLAHDGIVAGIDFSPDMVKTAESVYRGYIASGRLDLKCASIENIPYGANYFNTVFTANTIYFWPDPVKNILEIKRVLRKNGMVIIGFRCKEQMTGLNIDQEIFKLYNPGDVELLLKNAGFRRVDIRHKIEKEMDSYCAIGIK